jgi:hypothetical protein
MMETLRPLGVPHVYSSIIAVPDCRNAREFIAMLKWLLTVAIALAILTVISPWLAKRGLGRLPGDVIVSYKGRRYYLPFTTTILLSLALTLLTRLI